MNYTDAINEVKQGKRIKRLHWDTPISSQIPVYDPLTDEPINAHLSVMPVTNQSFRVNSNTFLFIENTTGNEILKADTDGRILEYYPTRRAREANDWIVIENA